jgi:putative ABC transport system permease protein
LLIAFGFVVAGTTLLVLLMIPAGLNHVAGKTGNPDVAVVLPRGAMSEGGGSFPSQLAGAIASMPGVSHSNRGRPLVAPQFVVDTRLRRTNGDTATVLVRGVTPIFWSIIDNTIYVTSGQRFQSGRDDLIAGVAATRGFVSLDTGDTVLIHGEPWHVSGKFTAGGGFWESELWTDISALQSTYNAQGKLTALWVKLISPAAFKMFNKALKDDRRTQNLYALPQPKFYVMQTGFLRWFIHIAIGGVALALGLGAILAIVNAVGMALDARRRDLALLRAVGFGRLTLAVAILIEVALIGVTCAGIAVLFGWLSVNNHEVGSSTLNGAVQFTMHMNGYVIIRTIIYLLGIGLLSAIWPVIRATHAPVTTLLRGEE